MNSRFAKTEKLDLKLKPEPYDTVLTLEHLSVGIYIWLLMLLETFCNIGLHSNTSSNGHENDVLGVFAATIL